MPKKPDPLSILREAYKHREKANELEALAIRLALEECQWFEAPAAKVLELSRSTLKQLLLTRHKAVGEEAAKRRDAAGYKAGNPHRQKI